MVVLVLVLAVGVAGLLHTFGADDAGPQASTRTRMPSSDRTEGPSSGEREEAVTRGSTPAVEIPRAPARPAPDTEAARTRSLNEAGIAALQAGDLATAIERFEECLAARPGLETYEFNLSEALARLAIEEWESGDRATARARLVRARTLAPDREDLTRILERWEEILRAEEELWQYETDHFELAFDVFRGDLLYGAQDILDVLEQSYLLLASTFAHDPVEGGRARVRVVVTEREDFQRATGLGEWAGGAFDGTIRLPLADLPAERSRFENVLRHELVHVFVRDVAGRDVPGWLNEGLCQYLEEPGDALVRAARTRLEGLEPLPLETLTGSLIRWDDPEEVGRAYAQALVFVDGIARTYGREVLIEMLRGCAAARAPGETFEEKTGVPLGTAYSDLGSS